MLGYDWFLGGCFLGDGCRFLLRMWVCRFFVFHSGSIITGVKSEWKGLWSREQYVSCMFHVVFRFLAVSYRLSAVRGAVDCLNQDFQDYRIFRIRVWKITFLAKYLLNCICYQKLYHFYMITGHYFVGRVEAVAKPDLQDIMTICQLEMVLDAIFTRDT